MANKEGHRAVDVCDRDTSLNTDPQDEEFEKVYNKKGRQRIKPSTWSLIRPLPDPPLQSGRYVLCNRGVTCRGPQCTFAHSQEEMESWNRQLHDQMRHRQPATEMSSYHRQLHLSMIPDWPTPSSGLEAIIKFAHGPATEMSSRQQLQQSMTTDWPMPIQSVPVPRPVRSVI